MPEPKGEVVDVKVPDRQPTNENLAADCASVADQLEECWAGEVECIVVMARRRDNSAMTYAFATTMEDQPRVRAILNHLAKRELRLVKRGGLVTPKGLIT